MTAVLSPTTEAVVWQRTTLGVLSEYVTSGSRDWKQYYASNGALFIRTQDIASNRLDLKDVPCVALPQKVEGKRSLVKRGDLLITITGNVGRVAVVDFDIPEAYVSQSVCLVRLKDPSLAPFLRHQLLTRRGGKSVLEAMAYGLGRAVLNLENIRSAEVILAPPGTRERIVAEIEKQFSRLDEAVANLKRVKANLKRYKAAVLKAAVEGGLVPTEAELAGRQRRSYENGDQLLERIAAAVARSARAAKKPQPSSESGSGLPFDLPEGWTVAPIADLAELVEYGSSAKASEADAGVPVLRMGNIVDGDLDLSTLKYLPDSHEEFPRLLLRPGDLLFNRTNSPELVGKTAVYKGSPASCSFASYLIRVRLMGGCLPEFVSAFINSVHGRRWVKAVVTQQVGQANVNGTKLKNLLIPVPPVAEQRRIVEAIERRASLASNCERLVESLISKGATQRSSLLSRAFACEE